MQKNNKVQTIKKLRLFTYIKSCLCTLLIYKFHFNLIFLFANSFNSLIILRFDTIVFLKGKHLLHFMILFSGLFYVLCLTKNGIFL